MYTFEDAKKAKWMVQRIYKNLKNKEIKLKIASLFLESDEDDDLHSDMSDMSEYNFEFEEFILFGAMFHIDLFVCSFYMTEKNTYLDLVLYGELPQGRDVSDSSGVFNLKYDWRDALITLCDILDRENMTDENYYETIISEMKI